MSAQPLFSVIIPTYNRKETLLACLRSLALQTAGTDSFEVIVVDDGSTDGTAEALEARGSELGVRLTLCRQEQAGPGAARNLGAARAKGEILAFTEDDVTLDAHWLERARGYFDDPATSALEGKTLLGNGGAQLRLLETGRQLGFVPCNFFVRARDFRAAGGYASSYFDPATKLYFREDADFGFKLLEAGKRVLFAEDVVVTHPPLYRSASEYLRHARRYYFDALLYREHPRLYRAMIEVKHAGPFTLRRPFHYLSVLYLLGLLLLATGAALVSVPLAAAGGAAAGASLVGIWYRYERGRMRAAHMATIARLPFVYAGALVRGCVRFGSYGVLR